MGMFVYAALGDSITSGRDASSAAKAFPWLLGHLLSRQGMPVKPIILAHSGWTSGELAAALLDDPEPLCRAHAATVWIGGDDLIDAGLRLMQGNRASFTFMCEAVDRHLSRILLTVRRAGVKRVVCCRQYNPFPNSPVSATGVTALNHVISGAARRFECAVAPADRWFAGREHLLIAGYRSGALEEVLVGRAAVHPNDEGHRVIAAGLLPFLM